MKVMFLDIDGVLNCRDDLIHNVHISNDKVCLLNRIVERTQCSIVISSSWRIIHDIQLIRSALRFAGLPSATSTIIGATPSSSEGLRGQEIRRWLEDNKHRNIESFVIIDDDSFDIDEDLRDNFVHTSFEQGLTEQHVEQAVAILGEVKDD